MKKTITTIALSLLSISLSAQVPSTGLVGYWPFTGNANDLSGNANNGLVSGATLTTDRNGNANSAYTFDGVSNYIEIPYSSIFDNSTYSFSFWVKTSVNTNSAGGPNVNQGIIGRLPTGGPTGGAGAADNWIIFEVAGNCALGSAGSAGGGPVANAQTFPNISDNTWHHVAYTVSSNKAICYLDGVKKDSNLYTTPITYQPYPTRIGRVKYTYWKAFQGEVDDIAIYNRPLTFSEVQQLYTGLAPTSQLCLNTPTNYAANADPRHAVSSDFNGDGFADLAVANYGSGGGTTISVFIGNGSGNFAPAVNYTAGSGVHGIISADFNADGKIDLATANRGSNNISVLLGNGLGGFATAVNFAVGTNPQSLINADFNGDGFTDLAITNTNSNNVSIKLGNGLGSFGTSTNFTAGTAPNSVVAKDFNGDSFVDLAVSNGGTNNVSILLGNGSGSFGAATNYTTGIGPSTVISKDFNADGKLDLAVSNLTSNNVSVLLGAGTGIFGTANNFTGGGSQVWAVISEDFDGDGKLDLATANYSASTAISILQGNGSGGFNAAVNFSVVGSGTPISLISGDFNGDGKKDIATTNYVSNNASVFINCTSITTGIGNLDPINSQHVIKVWPNPTTGHITIDNGTFSDVSGFQLKITNTLGQQVFQSAITQQQFYVDLSTWSGNGLYFLHIIDAKGNIIDTKKIVLQ